MHPECLREEEKGLLSKLKDFLLAHQFIMAGGTALALILGHRKSIDLDFFTNESFTLDFLLREIEGKGIDYEILAAEEEALIIIINQTKASFFYDPYPLTSEISYQDIPLASIESIAAMKLLAISQRGAKRDFVDLYFILQKIPFHKVAEAFIKRYGKKRTNPIYIGKSLVYFFDADSDPDPEYLPGLKIAWEDIKAFFKAHIRQLVLDLEQAKK